MRYKKLPFIICTFFINLLLLFFSFNNENEISFIFCGDFIPHDFIRNYANNFGYKFLFNEFLQEINSNLSFINSINDNLCIFYNLETPILSKMKPFKSFIFSEEKRLPSELADVNFQFISIANNHILDWGYEGFLETYDILNFLKKEKNIKYSGYLIKNKNQQFFDIQDKITNFLNDIVFYNFESFENNGIKICFISITLLMNNLKEWFIYEKKLYLNENINLIPSFIPIINFANLLSNRNKYLLLLVNQIKKLKEYYDILIVGIHWGNEYEETPQQYQIELSKILIENGVDIIWGHHSHIPGKIMIYKDKIVIFSNGNLLSGQARSLNYNDKNKIHKNYFYTKSIPFFVITLKVNFKNNINQKNYNRFLKIKSIKVFPFYQLNSSKNLSIKLINSIKENYNLSINEKENLQKSKEFIKKQFFNYLLFPNENMNNENSSFFEIKKIEEETYYELLFIYK
ncbi:MAG: CapA family protein [Spirochaetes bacterium]|nr:CapA family protein [Spirochaetota bacterium]